ncbi:hypothetical protein LshimejAT787_0200480 [Lyophyllum shimeji]|uniref:Uncharacterized protein n=1 Tax=Lyophyllum shimeji TaxID=47721 RepID=A0A9P3PEK8_LYOSH|nr:hypothetical protein LshimejAT787_0200480 [Lyophyllum shimeji]
MPTIDIDEIPESFVMVSVGNKNLLLPRHFLPLLLRYLDEPNASSIAAAPGGSTASTNEPDDSLRTAIVKERIQLITEAEQLHMEHGISIAAAMEMIYVRELIQLETIGNAKTALTQLRREVEAIPPPHSA